jgi:MarR family transcriptional regulator, transcriptional regulator for hemolysin
MFNPLRTFGFLLKDVSDRYMQRFEERAGALGLTLLQCRVLVDLVNHEGISQSQLAELTDIDPMTLVRILDRMESDGWLERRNDSTDSRTPCLYLRAKSKPLVNDIWYLADLTRREAFAGIPSAQADIVIAMLEQVESNFASLEPLRPAAPVAPLLSERVKSGATRSRRERTALQP